MSPNKDLNHHTAPQLCTGTIATPLRRATATAPVFFSATQNYLYFEFRTRRRIPEKLRQVPQQDKKETAVRAYRYDTIPADPDPRPTSMVTLCICMPTKGRAAGLARLALPPHAVALAADRTAGAAWMTKPASQRRSQETSKRKVGLYIRGAVLYVVLTKTHTWYDGILV